MPGSFTISCLLRDGKGHYYDSGDWVNGVQRASILLPLEAERVMRRLDFEPQTLYYIQNRAFDFYDGKGWALDLVDAKPYATLEDARAAVSAITKHHHDSAYATLLFLAVNALSLSLFF